jgi:Protein of unknown function (DUF3108)
MPALCLTLSLWPAWTSQVEPPAAAIPVAAPSVGNDPAFQHGEELVYTVYYNWNFVWLSAGEVTFRVFDEGQQFHFQAKGKTFKSYEWFFQVKDDYDSWVDKHSLLPNYSERSVHEGTYNIFEKIAFNQANQKTTVWRAPKRGQTETRTDHTVQGSVHDVLSCLYFLRTIDFTQKGVGATEPFRVFMDQAEYPLQMRYKGKDARKKLHGLGRYNALRFQPDLIAGSVFKEDAKMTVWVSDDANRIPLLIESPVSVGSVKVVLKKYSGLKYTFTAHAD